ncbi:aldo/keto reductase [Micrococcales bacterium 31B]|nr:aldo/keto reductase [Micrococcales bacterium 31B]
MEYVRLGTSGLHVSRVILGCMSYGDSARGSHAWTLPEAEGARFVRQAFDAGINTFDTADVYSDGTSEEYLGRALRQIAQREEVVIATKVNGRMGPTANQAGLSRVHILNAIDASLRRLDTDYVDLYQIHRWDPNTPIEETMEALNDVVRAGKARYIGASSMWAWQFAKAQHVAEREGWTRFVSMQDQYNLLQREEEREMHPLCRDQGVGVIPWSPLARGRVTRDWDAATDRTATDEFGKTLYHREEASNREIVEAVGRIAQARGVSRAQIALAWVRQQSAITAPIVGATKPAHLDDAIASLAVTLDEAECAALTSPYTPRLPEGF